jgi:hypothetical protein
MHINKINRQIQWIQEDFNIPIIVSRTMRHQLRKKKWRLKERQILDLYLLAALIKDLFPGTSFSLDIVPDCQAEKEIRLYVYGLAYSFDTSYALEIIMSQLDINSEQIAIIEAC